MACATDEEDGDHTGKEALLEAGDLESASTSIGSGSRAGSKGLGGGMAAAGRLPGQWQARRYYPWLLPLSLAGLAALVAPGALAYQRLCTAEGATQFWRLVLDGVPVTMALWSWAAALLGVVAHYAYHCLRLRGSAEVPERRPGAEPLTHVVIVCSYRAPAEVLRRTFESIAAQQGLRRPPIAVFAAEARDASWQESFVAVGEACGSRLGRLVVTEHVLCEGEAAGKSANENWAAREVFRQLVDEERMNPFEVMVTIVDADSILSPTYLAHVEAGLRSQPDGRRLVYSGPLNVYRSLARAGLLVQALELCRCHRDTFHNMFSVPYPYSNYSLTLGFASEIGFWTPDVMPEDIHTVNKAMVNSFGSGTTVTIPAIICNDLVVGVADRYAQAKRHQFGSVTEVAWLVAVFNDMGLRFPAWWVVFTSEACRAGSLVSTIGSAAALFTELTLAAALALHCWEPLPEKAKLLLGLCGSFAAWQWLWFWAAELALWRTLLRQFPIERPSAANWLALVLLMPLLQAVNRLVFLIVPTLHALCHAAFRGELAYVCAPKGTGQCGERQDLRGL